MNISPPTILPNNWRLARRALLVSAATVLLHVCAVRILGTRDAAPASAPAAEKTVHIKLHPSVTAENVTALAPLASLPPQPRLAPPKHPVLSQAGPATPAFAAELPPASDSALLAAAQPADVSAPEASDLAQAVTHEAASDAAPTFATAMPESAQLHMQVLRTEHNRNPSYGVASIHWETTESGYQMRVEVGIDLLLTTLNLVKLRSSGYLGQAGIMPVQSSEARRTRAATATHFNHEEKAIIFSASNRTVPMQPGAQDKASFLMQLAAIGNADAHQFTPGRIIALQVAEEKEATLFEFTVLGQEEIDSKLGKLMTWHLVRLARPGAYNSQLDLWYAPSIGWYPVQIRNTESNGAVTTQTLSKISKIGKNINQER